jgi:hypothetical protein
MSMWSRLKVALLTASVAVAALAWGGCLDVSWNRIMQYVAIGSLFD